MRHYAIRSSNVGVSKQVKSLFKGKLPKLGDLEDVSEYIDGGVGLAGLSDSEAEDEGSVRFAAEEHEAGPRAHAAGCMKLTK